MTRDAGLPMSQVIQRRLSFRLPVAGAAATEEIADEVTFVGRCLDTFEEGSGFWVA